MLIYVEKLIRDILKEPFATKVTEDKDFWSSVIRWMEEHLLYDFLQDLFRKVDEIIEIDPDLPEPRIFEKITRYMVEFIGAQSASVRIYDPNSEQMISYGSYPSKEESRATFIPLENSVAGAVVKSGEPRMVPDILKEELFLDKDIISKRGVQSLMAVPLEVPRFFPSERNMVGVIQVYFSQKDRTFSNLEVQVASMMAKRLSFVIARKKILLMNRLIEKREAIVQHIFRRIGSHGGLKMKDAFNSVIPDLADMISLQSCALFRVTEDLKGVVLESGYPEEGYHSIGKTFSIEDEPAFEFLLELRDYKGDSVYEVVTPYYIHVVDPQKTRIISDDLKRLAAENNINSILYIPLRVDGEITHILTLDALDQRHRYRDEEIDIFLFLGRELMKARKMERLDDALHDFKNPAIATAGFARRLKKLVEDEWESSRDKIRKYADVLLEETSRLQELALSIYKSGDEQVVNLTEVLLRRFEINKEAIREQLRQNINMEEGPFDYDIYVKCYPIHLERVFDNLLNNSTKAIPLMGGTLSIQTFAEGGWGCVKISNTGEVPREDHARLLEGESEGRGLYITRRIIRFLKGKMDVQGGDGMTSFMVCLPLEHEPGRRRSKQLSFLEPEHGE